MAQGKKTGGRLKGTPNKLTKEIRVVLKNVIHHQVEILPDLLNSLEPQQRIEVLIKIFPFVLPKIESIGHQTGEPFWSGFPDE